MNMGTQQAWKVVIMVGIMARFFGGAPWNIDGCEPPWGNRPSIYEHIVNHTVAGEPGLAEGGEELPDHAEVFDEGSIRWAAGTMEGILGGPADEEAAQKEAREILGLIKDVLKSCRPDRVNKLYTALQAQQASAIVDPLLQAIIDDGKIDPDRAHDLAVWIATHAPDREPVKIALSILGVLQGYDDLDIILNLARHEEFTLYASVAVLNNQQDPEPILWHIAKNVDGWGRIQTVNRLAETTDPAIQNWLLREGYLNRVMIEYLAYTCATAGDLKGALSSSQVDDALLQGAGDIIQALITGRGGPVAGMWEYADGAEATRLYLKHLKGRDDTLGKFLILQTIRGFLESEEQDWAQLSDQGWSAEARQAMLASTLELIDQEKWREITLKGLEAEDPLTFYTAGEAANFLGIDTWDTRFARTAQGQSYWWHLMQTDDPDRIQKVIALAEEQLSLAEIATGPSNELGLGPGFSDHMTLDYILQDLKRFPGLGWPLIKASLQSPVVRNRNMALNVLDGWGQENWPPDTREYLEACLPMEPVDDVQTRMRQVLAGEPLDHKVSFPVVDSDPGTDE